MIRVCWKEEDHNGDEPTGKLWIVADAVPTAAPAGGPTCFEARLQDWKLVPRSEARALADELNTTLLVQ